MLGNLRVAALRNAVVCRLVLGRVRIGRLDLVFSRTGDLTSSIVFFSYYSCQNRLRQRAASQLAVVDACLIGRRQLKDRPNT